MPSPHPGLLSLTQTQSFLDPLHGIGPRLLHGIGPRLLHGIGPAAQSAGSDPELSACWVALRNHLVRGLEPAEIDRDPAPVGGAEWTHWGPPFRALALHADALSGLRVRGDAASGKATLEVLVSESAASHWKLLASWTRPKPTYFAAQIAKLDELIPLRETRTLEIHAQISEAVLFLFSASELPLARMPYTLEFLSTALDLQRALQMQLKQQLGCLRPHVLQPLLSPMIDVPAHGSLPSGHAGESYLVFRLLDRLFKKFGRPAHLSTMVERMALRIAENRVVAGVHFPIDSLAGRMLASVVEGYLMAAVGLDAALRPMHFAVPDDLTIDEGVPQEGQMPKDHRTCSMDPKLELPRPDLPDHRKLWAELVKEWDA